MAWREVSNRTISFRDIDVSTQYDGLVEAFEVFQPDAVVHLAAQRSAPYSMSGARQSTYTLANNVLSISNVLQAIVRAGRDIRLVHLGSIGVYGYEKRGYPLKEGEVEFQLVTSTGAGHRIMAPQPRYPGSIYHVSKLQISALLDYYARYFAVKITDLYQGIVWGTQTPETRLDPRLVNRFDYDEQYGTVINRFLVQAILGDPLTIYGTGGQTRALIHIEDTTRCIELALQSTPEESSKVRILHQVAEQRSIRDIAAQVSRWTGAATINLPNPRTETEEHDFSIDAEGLLALGARPRTLEHDLASETIDTVGKHRARIVRDRMLPSVDWRLRTAKPRAAAEQ